MARAGFGGFGGYRNPNWPRRETPAPTVVTLSELASQQQAMVAPPPEPSPIPTQPPAPIPPTPIPTQPPEPTFDFYSYAQAIVPWLPPGLLDTWVDAYIESGRSTAVALARVRQDPTYDDYFPGNRRPDGTVRRPEQEYVSTFEGYNRVLIEAGVNPRLFTSKMVALYEGDTSVTEFQQRVSAVRTRILDNIDEVRAVFGEFYTVGPFSDAVFVAAALDPDVGNDILNRRIDIAQVAGSGRHAGFYIGRDFATRLVNRGFNQTSATQNLFDPARALLPGLEASAWRFGVDDTFSFDEFAQAAAFGDPAQQRRIRRLRSQEASLFTPSSFQKDGQRITGLVEQ